MQRKKPDSEGRVKKKNCVLRNSSADTLDSTYLREDYPVTIRSTILFLALALAADPARGDPGVEFFEKKVRPVLVEHCYQCHSIEAGKKKRGGLLLDSRERARKGGDTGPAVVPGKPAESLMLRAVRYTDDMFRMPPKGKLPDAVIADLEAWVKMGAPDPRGNPTTTAGA